MIRPIASLAICGVAIWGSPSVARCQVRAHPNFAGAGMADFFDGASRTTVARQYHTAAGSEIFTIALNPASSRLAHRRLPATDTTRARTHMIKWAIVGFIVGATLGGLDGYHRDRTLNCPQSAPCIGTEVGVIGGGLVGGLIGAIVGGIPGLAH